MAGEARLLHACVDFAESLALAPAPGGTAGELAARAAGLFAADSAAVWLVRSSGSLRIAASAPDGARRVAELELELAEGPAHDAVRSSEPVVAIDRDGARRWPRFGTAATRAGLRSLTAVPLRRRGVAVGALSLAAARATALPPDDVAVAQALADIGALAISEARAAHRARAVADQLQTALDARVVIEQAKGVVSERAQVSIDEAFAGLRRYARGRHQLLTDVARHVVTGELDPERVVHPSRTSGGAANERRGRIRGRSDSPRGAR